MLDIGIENGDFEDARNGGDPDGSSNLFLA